MITSPQTRAERLLNQDGDMLGFLQALTTGLNMVTRYNKTVPKSSQIKNWLERERGNNESISDISFSENALFLYIVSLIEKESGEKMSDEDFYEISIMLKSSHLPETLDKNMSNILDTEFMDYSDAESLKLYLKYSQDRIFSFRKNVELLPRAGDFGEKIWKAFCFYEERSSQNSKLVRVIKGLNLLILLSSKKTIKKDRFEEIVKNEDDKKRWSRLASEVEFYIEIYFPNLSDIFQVVRNDLLKRGAILNINQKFHENGESEKHARDTVLTMLTQASTEEIKRKTNLSEIDRVLLLYNAKRKQVFNNSKEISRFKEDGEHRDTDGEHVDMLDFFCIYLLPAVNKDRIQKNRKPLSYRALKYIAFAHDATEAIYFDISLGESADVKAKKEEREKCAQDILENILEKFSPEMRELFDLSLNEYNLSKKKVKELYKLKQDFANPNHTILAKQNIKQRMDKLEVEVDSNGTFLKYLDHVEALFHILKCSESKTGLFNMSKVYLGEHDYRKMTDIFSSLFPVVNSLGNSLYEKLRQVY